MTKLRVGSGFSEVEDPNGELPEFIEPHRFSGKNLVEAAATEYLQIFGDGDVNPVPTGLSVEELAAAAEVERLNECPLTHQSEVVL